MHATAPSSSFEPHDGHTLGVPPELDFAPLPETPLNPAALCDAAFTPGCDPEADGDGMTKGSLHEGHATPSPAEPSGTCIDLLHFVLGHRMT